MKMESRSRSETDLKLAATGLVITLVVSLALAACQAGPGATTPVEAPDQAATDPQSESQGASQAEGDSTPTTMDAEQPSGADLRQVWQSGPHSNTFVVTDTGVNSSCTRCHAPVNWVPTMEDIPESCLTCKFEIDPPPPLIPEEEWVHIECIVCHRVDKDEVDPAFAWLAIAPIEEYEEVSSASELCLKCHAGDSVADHLSVSVAGVHEAMLCNDCHDSHDGSASCSDSTCHVDAETPAAGHDPDHEKVDCVACHDAGELAVSPRSEDDIWTTWMVSETGEPSRPFSSHNTVLTAPCERCHFPDNPWELSDSVQLETP